MAYLHPCKNCKFEKADCHRRTAIREGIAGLGITSIKFKCGDRTPLFGCGHRVSFTWRVFEQTDCDDADEGTMTFHGTILFEASPTKYVVRVDRGLCVSASEDWDRRNAEQVFTRASDRLIVKVKTRDLTLIAEPPMSVCEVCGSYDNEETCLGWGDPKGWDSYWPSECRKKPLAA